MVAIGGSEEGRRCLVISENCFDSLDAPVTRVAAMDTPVPFAAQLEAQFLPKSRLDEAIDKLLNY